MKIKIILFVVTICSTILAVTHNIDNIIKSYNSLTTAHNRLIESVNHNKINIISTHDEISFGVYVETEHEDTEQDLDESAQDVYAYEPYTYLGEWTITHYCNCEVCCGVWAGGNTASGSYPTSNHTVATGDLPFGTQLLIDGQVYVVEDRGTPYGWVDIYCDTHEESLNRGMYTSSVYLIN